MTDPYSPNNQVPCFPDGEPITMGPFNSQQAPHYICENCKTPITVGQAFVMSYRYVLGCGQHTGRLVSLSHPKSKIDVQGQVQPLVYHEDCAAELAHDVITEEPCGSYEDDGVIACSSCGAEFYISDLCPCCASELEGEEGSGA